MTGFILNGHSYNVSVGSGDIEYASAGENVIGYSMYGENVPVSNMLTVTINAMPANATISMEVIDEQ